MKKTVGIVGGGIAGLYTAYRLQQQGHQVTVFEKEIGGLARGRRKNESEYTLEAFYHHFFLSDTDLLELLKELNISYHMKSTPMGFYANKKLFPFAKATDLLRFTPLSFLDRIRLGIMTLYFQYSTKGKDLHNVTVKQWISKYFSKGVYNNFWKPLLMAKFGREDIPASFIWGRINPRSKSRMNGKEVLCYPKGGFHVIFEKLATAFQKTGGKIIPQYVSTIKTKELQATSIVANKKTYNFDQIIVTTPNNIFTRLLTLPEKYTQKLAAIEYQGVVCAKLYVKKQVTPYYWINTDKHSKLSGVIEHTNFIDAKHYNNEHILYLFNYINPEKEIYKLSDTALKKLYLEELQKIVPSFDEKDILRWVIDRSPTATPVYNLHFDKKKPSFNTPYENVFLLNTSQVFPEDRNVSHGILYAKRLLRLL